MKLPFLTGCGGLGKWLECLPSKARCPEFKLQYHQKKEKEKEKSKYLKLGMVATPEIPALGRPWQEDLEF
jgi:hypothetical protein